jgi:hypothetical protein
MTRRRYLCLALGVLVVLAHSDAKNETEFVVIVHPSNQFDALSRSKLNLLFLRRVSRWPWGAEVEPINLASDGLARREFTRQVLRTTEEQLAAYWIDQRATRGVSLPIRVPDGAAAKALVSTRPGAIAYIPAAELDSTVKTLRVDP